MEDIQNIMHTQPIDMEIGNIIKDTQDKIQMIPERNGTTNKEHTIRIYEPGAARSGHY
jgi:hypothetical protein